MTPEKEQPSSEEQKDDKVRVTMVRPEGNSEKELRAAAKRWFEAITGKSADEVEEASEESELDEEEGKE